jgi:hypothetical protein
VAAAATKSCAIDTISNVIVVIYLTDGEYRIRIIDLSSGRPYSHGAYEVDGQFFNWYNANNLRDDFSAGANGNQGWVDPNGVGIIRASDLVIEQENPCRRRGFSPYHLLACKYSIFTHLWL